MKRLERKNLNRIRRITALLAAVTMLLSSCGSLAENYSSTGESQPILVSESYRLPLAEPEETEEPSSEPEPTEDLSALYPAGTLTYAGNGYSLRAAFSTEARIPAGSSLTATEPDEQAVYEYADALQNRLNSKKPDAPWQDYISDVMLLNPVFTDAEGNKVIPESGVVLTVQYDGEPAHFYRISGRTEALAENANTAEINDYTAGMIAILHTEKTQVGYDALEYRGKDYKVTVGYGPDAGFPADVQLKVREILPDTAEYREYNNQTEAMLDENWEQLEEFARYFDITFENGAGEKIEPKAYIDVEILFDDVINVAEETIDIQAVHFNEETGIEVIKSETDSNEAAVNNNDAIDTVSFSSDTFSVYAVVRTSKMTEKFITKRGWTYQITVTYGEEARIPSDAKLQIREILPGTEEYELYRSQTAAALESDDVETPGMFDITIVDGERNEVEPKAPVDVNITLLRTTINQAEELHVVHFKEEATTTAEEGKAESEILENDVDGNSVSFKTDSFSVYVLAYTVDFHYEGIDYSIEGNSQILLSELIQMLDIRNGEELLDVHDVENVTFTDEHLVTVQQVSGLITYNGAENKDVGDKEFLLSSLEPFTSDEKLTITLISGEQIIIGVTDEQVDNRITAEVYFLNTDGTRTSQAETESGNTLNARILLSNSNSNSGGKAYVKVSLDGLDDYVTLNESFKENAWDTITFRDMTTGVTFTMDVYYNTMDHSITYGVPAGATGIAALSFTAPNGITEDNKTLTLTPTLVDSNFNSITPEENDSISGPASGKWTSDFTWDPIQKYVNNNKENQVVVTSDNGTPKINTWLHYEYSANSQNRAETGVRWTDKAIIEDTLTLPAHMSFAGSYTCDTTDGRIYINGAPANDNILFGLTLKPNMTITNLEVRDGNKIYYRIEVTNPNRPDANSDLTAEMDNISYITELNAAAITLDPNYITASYYGEEIINAVSVTEKPCKGNDDETSQNQVKTKTKEDEGFTVNKESQQDGQYVQAGATIDYTIRVTNTGTVTIEAADSVVHDTLPSAVYLTEEEIARLQNVYGDKITIDGNNITFWTGELAPGAASELVIHATVWDSKALEQSGYTNESTITNTATYRGLSDYVASKLHAGSITAEKISDQNSGTPLENGQIVNFTLKAKNDTDYAYTGDVTFMDDLPPYLIVTLYDSTGTDITDATYAVEGTHNECYVRDSSNSLVPATVVINGDGSARITVNKTGGIAAHGNYAIVLSAKYDESKVNAKVNADGNVVFANTVNINNKQDHTDFTGKVGKVDLDKYVSEATLNGNQVTQPYSDGTIVTYNIHVVNDSQNPYTHDIVVTDTMPRGLVPIGLTVNGMTYDSWQTFVNAFGWQEKEATILDGSGNSQPVKVVQAYNGLKISWTIPNPVGGQNITSRDISYQALVKTDELVNQTTGLQDLENTATAVGREDKEIIVVDVKGVEISKKIVGPNGELLDTIEIGPGSVVTYELTIDNPEHLNTTVTGITDYLPQGGPQSTFPLSYWVLGETVLVDETTTGKNEFYINATPYPNQDANYGAICWFDNNHWLRFGDISIKSEQEKLVQRITLKYPDDPAILHTMFVDTVWGRQQRNKYSITGMTPVEVDHTEVANKKYYAQKSVIGLAKDIGYNYAALNSKDLFNIGDISDVFYTVIVANTGTGTLHINSLTDILPSELKFVGIANSDYNAGTHSYNGAITISTADQNNNPNYVIPAGYSGLSGVSVTATEPTGNTVLFKLNGDDGVDLPEKHVLAFDVQCKIKDSVTLTNGQAITNTFLASLDGDAVLSRIPITTQKTPDNSIQNNGGCSVVSNDGTTQIAESTVSIHPSNVAVPGILKKAIAYQPMHDTEWHALNDNTTNINSQSAVKWKITLYNDGAVPINLGYTLSDTIYEHHSFSSIESFTINGSTKDVTAGPFTSYTTTKEGQYNRYEFTFPAGADYAIPAGGKAELVLVTSFTTGQYQGQLDNEAIFSPVQEWDANRVIRGQLEKNEAGTAYTGVSSMDYVNMLGDGATMSYKIAAEKGNPENTAYGYDIATGKNYVTVDDTSTVITYTNHVQNLSNATFKRFVMIDRMPEIGDTGVVNAHEQRGSEYSIGFANALNLRLTFRNSDGTKSITLTEEDYTLEFSDHTSFTTEDWEGTSTWDASAADAKAFRLKLNPGTLTAKINDLENSTLSEAVFPSMWVLEVSYDGKLSTDGTPGQYAWNSFGYHYTTAADVNMSAEPTKAGVRIKPLPVLKKQVVDNQGVDQGIDTNVLFTFKFYEGSHTPEETASLPTIWTTTLYQGQAVQLLAQKTVNGVTTGHFTEGQEYTVIEEAVAGYDLVGYEKDGLKQTTIGYCVFKYSNELNTTIVCQNQISGFAPEAEKVLLTTSSRALQNGEFTFELLELSNADLNDLSRTEVIGNRIQQAGNDTAGHVQFDNMEFSAEGTYYYLLREVPGSDTSICYDDTVYLVAVQVDAAGGRFTATGTYYKVTESDDTDPIKAVQPVPAAELPEFINTESTQIEVQKIWAGDATTGTSTMVLYRTIGEQAAVPANTYNVTINATLNNTPADSGHINVSYMGSNGDFGTITLSNNLGWTGRTVTLKRGETYTFTYEVDGTKVTSVSSTETTGITDPTIINLSANAIATQNHTITFSVPSEMAAYNDGTITVVPSTGSNLVFTKDNWGNKTVSVKEESAFSYTVSVDGKFITEVDPVSGSYASVTENKTVTLTPTTTAKTRSVQTSVNWGGNSSKVSDGTTVVVTFTGSDGSTRTVMLSSSNSWSDNVELCNLDSEGNVVSYTVSYSPSTVTATGGLLTLTGADSPSGDTYNITTSYVDTVTVYFDKNGYDDAVIGNVFTSDWRTNLGTPYYDSTVGKYKLSGLIKNAQYWVWVGDAEYTVSGADEASGNNVKFTATEGATIAVTGTVTGTMKLIITRDNGYSDTKVKFYQYNRNAQHEYDYLQGTAVEYTITENGVTIENIPLNNDYDGYYCLTIDKLYAVPSGTGKTTQATTDASVYGKGYAYGNLIWFKAQAGTVHIHLKGTDNNSFSVGALTSRFRRLREARLIASGGTTDSPLGTATTFADASVGGIGTAFTAIRFKDLPAGAEIATDVPGFQQVIQNNGSYTWTNLPAVDEEGHPIYYYVVEKEARANAGEMSVSYSYEYNDPNDLTKGIKKVTITNTTTKNGPEPGNLSVTKHIVGGSATSFIFRVELGDTAIDGTYGEMSFNNGVATFRLEDGQTITATGLPAGTTYTVTETDANTGWYVTTSTGETGTIPENATASAVFTNTYNYTASGSVPFKAKKILIGGDLSAGQYSFTLAETDHSWNAPEDGYAQTVFSTGNGDVIFDDVPLTSTDTRYFTITETIDEEDETVIYDPVIRKITVTVTDDGEGHFVPSKTYDPASTLEGYDAVFTNTKKGALKITKAVTVNGAEPNGSNVADGDYVFTVTAPALSATAIKYVQITVTDGVAVSYKVADTEAELSSATAVTTSGEAVLEGLTPGEYTITEAATSNGTTLSNRTGGTNSGDRGITLTVTAGSTASANVAAFTNNKPYNSVPFKAKKTLEGATLTAGQFSFTLTEYTDSNFNAVKTGGVSESVSNAAPGESATFGDVTFEDVELTSDGERYFIIKETVPTGQEADGTIVYDTHEQKITVSVTNTDGVLTYTKTYTPEYSETGYDASFTNTKKGALKITKAVTVNGAEPNGSNVADGDYVFTVTAPALSATAIKYVQITVTDGVAVSYKVADTEAELSSATAVTTSGEAVLEGLTPGEYTITEAATSNGTTLSNRTGGTDSGERGIMLTVTAGSTASANVVAFTNNKPYNSVPFKAKKTLEGATLTAGQFNFTLTEYTDSNFNAVKTGGVSESVSNAAPGESATFGDVTFEDVELTSDGERYFIIKETVPTGQEADGTIVYDTHEQKITVSVTNTDGVLTYTKTYTPEYSETGYDATFENEQLGSVQVTKTFSGVDSLPANFQIRAEWTIPAAVVGEAGTTFTVYLKTGTDALSLPSGISSLPTDVTIERIGDGTTATPYQWKIKNLPIGTEVTFAEENYTVPGYNVTSTVSVNGAQATAGITGSTSSAVTTGTVAFENVYTPGVELPATGGPGTMIYTVAGLMLITLAGVLLVARKRKTNQE